MDEKLDGQVYVISTDEGESIAEDNKGFILVFDTIKQISDWAVANNIPFERIIVDKVNGLGVGEDDKYRYDFYTLCFTGLRRFCL